MTTKKQIYGYDTDEASRLGILLTDKGVLFYDGGPERLKTLLAEGNPTARDVVAEITRRKMGIKPPYQRTRE